METSGLTHDQKAMVEAHKAGRAAWKLTIDEARAKAREFASPDETQAYYAGYRGERIRQNTWEGGR
jgi:hypothetical protein